ncbi:1-phosphatidylinositol-3-phosphate 5-kinase [Rhodotorula paludigena]|uniref:1-phosphatidylinositol-3-phosphate 5-kinase n=1 Tax=Rhodotorula paludigena TaxID=86838 RepID=UPI0031820BCF
MEVEESGPPAALAEPAAPALDSPDSSLEIDASSWRHIELLCRQSLRCCKLSETVWQDPLLAVLHELEAFLTPALIAEITSAKLAQAHAAALEPAFRSQKPQDRSGLQSWFSGALTSAASVERAVSNAQKDDSERSERRRARWREAAMLLRPADGEEEPARHAREDTLADWHEVDELPRLAVVQLRVKTVETTIGAVKSGAATMGVSFALDEWEGQPLFGAGEPDLDEQDLKVVDRCGGTFRITSTPRELLRLERILELLAFAVVSLKLEVHLLRDLSCPHPPTGPDPESTPLAPTSPVAADEPHDPEADDDVMLPGAFRTNANSTPGAEWQVPKRWRGRWSAAGASSWLQLVLPRPDVGRKRSLRRTSTRYSTIKSPPPLSDPMPADLPSSPNPSSHHSTLQRPLARVRDRVKGFGEHFRLRKRTTSHDSHDVQLHKALTIETDTLGGGADKAWDILGGLHLPFLGSHEESQAEQAVNKPEKTPTLAQPDPAVPLLRFEKVVQDLAEFVLSVSPDVLYPPPYLLFRLREQELLAAEQAPLVMEDELPRLPERAHIQLSPLPPPPLQSLQSNLSIGTEAFALNFARGSSTPANELPPPSTAVVPVSNATRIALDAKAGLASLLTNNSSLAGCIRHQSMQFLLQAVRRGSMSDSPPCYTPHWVTLSFYQAAHPSLANTTSSDDATLECFFRQLVRERDEACETCASPKYEHSVVLMHQRERITITLVSHRRSSDDHAAMGDEPIVAWTQCATCAASSPSQPLSQASGGFSLAKFLELLLYDSNFVPRPDLCEHAAQDRHELVRCFSTREATIEFKLDSIDLFELRLPTAVDPDLDAADAEDEREEHHLDDTTPADELQAEITQFFASTQVRLDLLEERLVPPPPRSAGLDGPSIEFENGDEHARVGSTKTVAANDGEGTAKDEHASLDLLRRLRRLVHDVEDECLNSIVAIALNCLNDARYLFEAKGKAVKLRLNAWESKHADALATGPSADVLPTPTYDEPEYFADDVHAFPVGSSVLARDAELSSFIALALSASSFHDTSITNTTSEMQVVTPSSLSSFGSMQASAARRPAHKPIPFEFLHPAAASPASSTPPRSPLRQSLSGAPDPDDPDAVFGPPAEVEYLAKPRKTPRVASGSMFRNLVRKKSSEVASAASSSASTPVPEQGESDKRYPQLPHLSDSVLDDILKTPESTLPRRKPSRPLPSLVAEVASKRDSAKASASCDVQATAVSSSRSSIVNGSAIGTMRSIASSVASSTPETGSSAASLHSISTEDEGDDEGDEVPPLQPSPAPLSSSRFLSHHLDGFFSGWDSARSRLSPATTAWRGDEGAAPPLAPSEHVKFKFRQGNKTFRVTSYFERRFRTLRVKCGLSESLFIESLTRCTDLNPSGGKSSATFLMTADERFMLKELVTKLGYSELDSVLGFAPKLLDYLGSPERPSLLAKIFGIYTLKFVDVKTGKKRKVDLILMEHLFFGKTISRQFDLKGIASRVVKPKPGVDTKDSTGWDGDWLTGSMRDQLLIYPHSKTLLRDALANDVKFLSENGGIDFSLLVGVDDAAQELVVGLIDTLGVFNTLKVIEFHTKTAVKLSDAASVTVQPPHDYARRFLAAMERYFIAVPDKWTRPPGDGSIDPDPRLACPL